MDSFTLFSALLPELQDVIWDHAISQIPARLIELTGEVEDTVRTADGEIITVQYGYVSKALIPVVLLICARSRHLAKQRWTLTFDSQYEFARHIDGQSNLNILNLEAIPRTWFDFKADTLVFMEKDGLISSGDNNHGLEQFCRTIELKTRKRVQNIFVNLGVCSYRLIDPASQAGILCKAVENKFSGLKTVFVIFKASQMKWWVSKFIIGEPLYNPEKLFMYPRKGDTREEALIKYLKDLFYESGKHMFKVRLVAME